MKRFLWLVLIAPLLALAQPPAPSGPVTLIVDKTTGAIAGPVNAATFRSANGIGTGSGSVTSVGLSLPSILTVSNSPVTSSGTLTAVLATEVANTIFAGPTTGADATPTFRAMVNADVPTALTGKSYNGLTLTSTTGTFTLASGKTLTQSNTLTYTGTDGSTVAFGAGGTVLYSGGSYVSSITGTSGQITASASTGAVTISIPSAMTGINSITAASATALTLNGGASSGNVVINTNGSTLAATFAGANTTLAGTLSALASTFVGLTTVEGATSGVATGTFRVFGAGSDSSGLVITAVNSTDVANIKQTAGGGTLNLGGNNATQLALTSAGAAVTGVLTVSGNLTASAGLTVASGQDLKLGNAVAASTPIGTGTVAMKDSAGATIYVMVSTIH